ncbi:hypothetical protein GCM10007904_11390 [Oharaeibacter diazotrophicus]|nr:hypothetical protein GCM10007904_11390 [Oharaeibacter diazotrophicus]
MGVPWDGMGEAGAAWKAAAAAASGIAPSAIRPVENRGVPGGAGFVNLLLTLTKVECDEVPEQVRGAGRSR